MYNIRSYFNELISAWNAYLKGSHMQMPLILMFMEIMYNQPDNIGKLVTFADDFPVAGILTDLKFL